MVAYGMKEMGFRFGEAISGFAAEPRPDAVWTIMACGAYKEKLKRKVRGYISSLITITVPVISSTGMKLTAK